MVVRPLTEAAATETDAPTVAVTEDEAKSVGMLLAEAAAESDAEVDRVQTALVDSEAVADDDALLVECTVCVSVGIVAFDVPDVVPVGDVDADEHDEAVGSDVGVGGGASVTVLVIDGTADSAEETDAEALAAADCEAELESEAAAVGAPLRLGLRLAEALDDGCALRDTLRDDDEQRDDEALLRALALSEGDALEERDTALELEARGDTDSRAELEWL